MSVEVSVKLDTRELEAYLGKAKTQLYKNLRSAVDKTARAARKAAIDEMAKDSGVPPARFRASTPLIQATTQGGLTAYWTVKKAANVIRGAGSSAVPNIVRGSPVAVSTFRDTGGGSSNLVLRKAFAISGNGGSKLVMVRTGKGRQDIKVVYAESPNQGMGQADGAPRRIWTSTARKSLATLVAPAVEKALHLADAPISIVGGD